MKKNTLRIALVVFVVLTMFTMGFLVFISNAYAQATDTATPLPTHTASVTPTPTVSYEGCPHVRPDGYGTITPSSLWQVECAHCFLDTKTPAPTSSPQPSETPWPTVTHSAPTQTHIATAGTPTPWAATSTPTPTGTTTAQSCEGVAFPTQDLSTPDPDIRVNDDDVGITYNNEIGNCWYASADTGTLNADSRISGDSGCSLEFNLPLGVERIRLYGSKYNNRSRADVYANDVFVGYWNQYKTGSKSYSPSDWLDVNPAVQNHVKVITNLYTEDRIFHWDGYEYSFYDGTELSGWGIDIVATSIGGAHADGYDTRDWDCEPWGTGAIHCTGYYAGNEYSNILNADFSYKLDIEYIGGDGNKTVYVRTKGTATGIWAWGGVAVWGPIDRETDWDYEGTHNVNDDVGILTIFSGSHHDSQGCNCNHVEMIAEWWISPVPFICDPTIPIPEPEDPIGGYCSTLMPSGGMFGGFGFDLFQPDPNYQTNCDIGWEEFGFDTYTVPAVEICFQPTVFGVVKLFNVDFPVGTFGLVVAAAAIWRYFTKI